MKRFTIILLLLVTIDLSAQEKKCNNLPFLISIYNNSTILPGALLKFPLHPGISIGTMLKYKDSEKSTLFQTFRAGYYYHKYSMSAIQLYTNFGYKRWIFKNIGLDGTLLAGYHHSIPDVQIFKLNGSGQYEAKVIKARSQFITGADFGLSYKLKKDESKSPELFLRYQFYLEMPFVSGYAPILPNTALHLGAIFYIKR